MALILGLNSGSSFDGIDAVLAETDIADDGHPTRPRFIEGYTHKWPARVEALVQKAFVNQLSIFELTRLNYIAGACYAEAARTLLRQTGTRPEDVTVIGYDGQTIYQEPPDHARMHAVDPASEDLVGRWLDGPYPCGLQIGESSVVACHTDIDVVSHFRAADHAFGGTGAPLMQYLDYVAFRNERPMLTLNIGGIANFQLANADRRKMMAFDTGPGCVMVDHTARRLFDRAYDPDGSIAASGKIDAEMMADLLSHPYFKRPPPRSAWKLDFGAAYCDGMIDKWAALAKEDIMATFAAFTAKSIAIALRDYIPDLGGIDLVAASGGGTRNKTLMGFIANELPDALRLTTTDEFGIPAQFKEAIKFATLAFAAVNHVANNIPACSGASRYTVMGRLALAPRRTRGAGPL
ncbi:MAG: anhydro-N-acetylmuramic acid kinase [Alphaproteobacteria bacterium]